MKTPRHYIKTLVVVLIAFVSSLGSTQDATAQCSTCPSYNYTLSPSANWATDSWSITANGCKIYKFTAVQGNTYIFKTGCGDGATAEFDTYLHLYDAGCNQLDLNDDGCENARSTITWTADYSGDAYVKIRGYNSTASGTYTLAYQSCQSGVESNFDYSQNGFDLNFSSSSVGTGLSYNWNFGDNEYSTSVNPSHTYSCPGTYTVTLEVTDGCGNYDYSQETVVVDGGNLFASYTYSGSGTTIDFTNTSQGTNVVYSWDFGDGTTSTVQDPQHTFACSGSYYVQVIATDDNGNGCTAYAGQYVQVYSDLNAVFTFNADNGTAVSFSNTSTGSNLTYDWDFGDGTSGITTSSPTHTYNCPGQYYVGFSVGDGNGCYDSFYSYVVVTGDPKASFETVTSGNSVIFANTSVGNNLSHSWYFSDGTTSTEMSPAHTFNCGGSQFAQLTVTDANGCTDLTQQYVDLNQGLTAEFSYVTAVTSVIFQNTSNGQSSSWYWEFDDGSTSTMENPTHSYNCPGEYYVYQTVTDANGCSSYYNQLVSVGGVTAQVEDTVIGNTVQFSNASPNGTNWLWNFGDGTTSTDQNPSHTYDCPGWHWVEVAIESAGGCTTNGNAYVFIDGSPTMSTTNMGGNTISFSMTGASGISSWFWEFGDGQTSTEQSPTYTYQYCGNYSVYATLETNQGCLHYAYDFINIQGSTGVNPFSNGPICKGELLNLSSGGAVGSNYSWYGPNNFYSSDNNPSIEGASSEAGGTYYFQMQDAQGCPVSDSVVADVYPQLGIELKANGKFKSEAEGGGAQYQWINCDDKTAITGATSRLFDPTVNGTYAVVVTQGSCPSDTSDCLTISNVGIEDIEIAKNINIYPNPTSGTFVIQGISGKTDVNLTDMQGRVIWKSQTETGVIDISDIADGAYMLTLQVGEYQVIRRIVKN